MDSLQGIHLFFTMFNTLSEYTGQEGDFHHFRIRKLYENNSTAPNFFFIFDDDMKLTRARIE